MVSAKQVAPKKPSPFGLSRRDLLRGSGLVAAVTVFDGSAPLWAEPPLSFGSDLYESIGVRPLINCKGTFTILSGSLTSPEVKTAMMEASKHFVHIDELMEAVGKRLAELTGAVVILGSRADRWRRWYRQARGLL